MITWLAPSMVVSNSGLATACFYSLNSLVVTLGLADTDVSDALVSHNSLYISEVKVDKTRTLIRSVIP